MPRVVVWEGVNARHLEPGRFPERPTLATVDVSFISLDKVLPAVAACLADPAEIVALVKPQFEVGRGQVGKGGVVRAWEARRGAVRGVARRRGAGSASAWAAWRRRCSTARRGTARSSSISPATSDLGPPLEGDDARGRAGRRGAGRGHADRQAEPTQ